MSTITQELSSHSLSLIKRVTIEVGADEQIIDSENFQDIRMELNSTGHNLVIFHLFIKNKIILIALFIVDFCFDESTRDNS